MQAEASTSSSQTTSSLEPIQVQTIAANSIDDIPSETYPPIQPGASLMLAYRLENQPVLLIGGGTVASGRLYYLLEAGAHVTLISPPSTLHPTLKHRIQTYSSPTPPTSGKIIYIPRNYLGESDTIKITNFNMILTAIDDSQLSRQIYLMARKAKIPINVADVPSECDFYFGAQIRQGPLQVMVSTNGQGPKIAVMIKDLIKRCLPFNVEDAISGVGGLRRDLRRRAPGVGGELGRERMDWMIGECEAWSLGEMGRLNDERVRREVLDLGWERGRRIVGPKDVRVDLGGEGLVSRLRKSVEGLGEVGAGVWGVGIGAFLSGAGIATVATLYISRRYSR